MYFSVNRIIIDIYHGTFFLFFNPYYKVPFMAIWMWTVKIFS